MTKPYRTYLDTQIPSPEYLTSSADIRYLLIDTLQTLFQQTNHTLITPRKPTLDSAAFLNSLKTHPKIYQASLSRQFASDLPPDVQQTTLKDEPKDWYIKTADFGDIHDRTLQHRDGEYTQLLEDIQEYHQILQQSCDRIIVLRPPNYGEYDTLMNAAMQCLGYSLKQFQYIIIQPIKLYAFHKPSQKLHTIPDLPPNELLKAIGPDALRWHSLGAPLTEPAPINISTAGRPDPQDGLYRVQSAYLRCGAFLQQTQDKTLIELSSSELNEWQIQSHAAPSKPNAAALLNHLKDTQSCVQNAAQDVAPHYICQHLEALSTACHLYLNEAETSFTSGQLVSDTKRTIHTLLGLLGISVPKPLSQPSSN